MGFLAYLLVFKQKYGNFSATVSQNFSVIFSVIGLMERLSDQIIVSCVKKKRKETTENKGNGLKIK